MGILGFMQRRQSYRTVPLHAGTSEFAALVADTAIKRMIGLMYRNGLEAGACMLFPFRSESMQGIWMRNMRFPIDIIWADARKRVVHVVDDAQPCRGMRCKTYYPE